MNQRRGGLRSVMGKVLDCGLEVASLNSSYAIMVHFWTPYFPAMDSIELLLLFYNVICLKLFPFAQPENF